MKSPMQELTVAASTTTGVWLPTPEKFIVARWKSKIQPHVFNFLYQYHKKAVHEHADLLCKALLRQLMTII